MLLEGALIAVAVALLVPAIIVAVEAAAAVLPDRATGHPLPASSMGPARLAVLIPAHNESAQIAATISDVIDNLKGTARIVVVADNCSDDTALVAAAAGATVIERHDPERRGKGFAISFGLRHLDVDPPQAIILIDADCRVAAGSLQTLAELALRHQRPVQAEYLLVAPPTPRP
ncbi:MAG TPA: glycosyltransferase, partial [Polyangia bacterium]